MSTQNTFKNLSERLAHALNSLSTSQSELARQIGVKPQVIQYLCANKVNKSKFTYSIADALGINGTWLATGNGTMLYEDDPAYQLLQEQQKIPLVEWTQLNNHLPDTQPTQWILTSTQHSIKTFAVKMNDKSMWPRFDQNTLLIVDPSQMPTDQAFVLVYIAQQREVVLRELLIKENGKMLIPMNSALYKEIELTPKDKILGLLIEARWQI